MKGAIEVASVAAFVICLYPGIILASRDDEILTAKIRFTGPSTADNLVTSGSNFYSHTGTRDPNINAITGYHDYSKPYNTAFELVGLVKKSVDEVRKLFAPTRVQIEYHPATESSQIDPKIRKSLSMMADAIDNLDARLKRIEEQQRHSSSSNPVRWGSVTSINPPVVLSTRRPSIVSSRCKGAFRMVNNRCVFASVWTNQRTNWKNAEEICKGKGGKLAQPSSYSEFREWSQIIASSPSTAGFSYWLGSLYPGAIWIWMSGSTVSLDSLYWKPRGGSSFIRPGDTSKGRCLTFAYDSPSKSYYFKGDLCANDKFFLCEIV